MFDQVVQESNAPFTGLVVVAKLVIGRPQVAVEDHISRRKEEPVFPPRDPKVGLNLRFFPLPRLIQRKEKEMTFHHRKLMLLKQRDQVAVESKDLAFDSADLNSGPQRMKNPVQKFGVDCGISVFGSDVEIPNVGDRLIDHIVRIARRVPEPVLMAQPDRLREEI